VLQFERAPVDAAESEQLMQEFWREIDELYGNAAPTQWQLTGMEDPRASFVIARLKGDAVACAALRPLSETTVELKRMYVRPAARRNGIARQLVHQMEQLARDAGFDELWLETGLRQPAAVALYERLGYTRRAAFGDHKDDPLNVCFEKRLT
jgi:GNAT superfamily N-acetyltransferase